MGSMLRTTKNNKSPSISKTKQSGNKNSIKSNLFHLGDKQKDQIRRAFDLFSSDASGSIKAKELKVVMRALGFDMSRDELDRMIKDIDPKNTGKIDFDDFLQIIILQISKKDPEEELIKAFKLFDTKNTGKICFSDLKRVAVELEEKMSDEEIREMIEELDSDGDGYVTMDEFVEMMKKSQI